MILAADHVHVRYPDTLLDAVSGVSLTIRPGELVAITGPNGCGKTSLLRALLGLVRPAAGTVTLDDTPVFDVDRRTLARAIAALPQREEPAFPLRVRELVAFGRYAMLGPVDPPSPADRHAIARAIERCNLSGFEDRSVDTLSGGEWQRARLARALSTESALLLLDEPTSSLDLGHAMALFELLRALATDGLGVLVITHDLNMAIQFADRIVLMAQGAVVTDGPPEVVADARVLGDIYGWPVDISRDADRLTVVPRRRSIGDLGT